MVEIVDVNAWKIKPNNKVRSLVRFFRLIYYLKQDEVFCGRGAFKSSLGEIETKPSMYDIPPFVGLSKMFSFPLVGVTRSH